VIGLPVALCLAWVFELTPEGLKRTEAADAMPAATIRKKHAWIYVIVIGGFVSIGLFFLGRYSASTKQNSSPDASAKSIALLPFENLSRDPDNAYFAEGIEDEIVACLAKIADLSLRNAMDFRQDSRLEGDLLQINRALQEFAGRSAADREKAWSLDHSGGKRAKNR
jgi:hypothetical protein